MFGRGPHSASQRISGVIASGHCEAANVMVATLALIRQDVKRSVGFFQAEAIFGPRAVHTRPGVAWELVKGYPLPPFGISGPALMCVFTFIGSPFLGADSMTDEVCSQMAGVLKPTFLAEWLFAQKVQIGCYGELQIADFFSKAPPPGFAKKLLKK